MNWKLAGNRCLGQRDSSSRIIVSRRTGTWVSCDDDHDGTVSSTDEDSGKPRTYAHLRPDAYEYQRRERRVAEAFARHGVARRATA
jgi:hypothetical protein